MAAALHHQFSRLVAACITLLLLIRTIPPCTGFAAAAKSKASSTAAVGFGANKNKNKNSLTQQQQPHIPDETASTQRLLQFLQRHKAVLDGTVIGIDPVTGMRGLYATKNFSKDKVLCKIPSDLALALSDPTAAAASDDSNDDAPTIAHGGANFLTLYKNNPQAAAQWAFYLDSLPTPPAPPSTNTVSPA